MKEEEQYKAHQQKLRQQGLERVCGTWQYLWIEYPENGFCDIN